MSKDIRGNKLIRKTPIEHEYWETDVGSNCPVGCWCRKIVTIRRKGIRRRTFIQQGWITKEQAELIVKVHNEWLKNVKRHRKK